MLAKIKDLVVAHENPRHKDSVDPTLIEILADSIFDQGLTNPLIGYEKDGYIHITAGGLRTRALNLLVDKDVYEPSQKVQVNIMPQDEAVMAGIRDELSHMALSETDELRAFLSPITQDMTSEHLAKVFGRSTKAIEQRRLVQELPVEIQTAALDGTIKAQHAYGLTYFRNKPDLLPEMFETCLNDKRGDYTLSKLQRIAGQKSVTTDDLWTHIIDIDAYTKRGGVFQQDLFAVGGTAGEFCDPDLARRPHRDPSKQVNWKQFDRLVGGWHDEVAQLGSNKWALYNCLTHWSSHNDGKNPEVARKSRETQVANVLNGSAWASL